MSILQINNLDFDDIKSNLIQHYQGSQTFKDYNFKGSALNLLAGELSYNTHYNAIFAQMLANELFIDSAQQKKSLTAKAKFSNYIPKSKTSSSVEVDIQATVTGASEPSDKRIIMKRGTGFTSNNSNNDNRHFMLLDDITIFNQSNSGYDYTLKNISIYEGVFKNKRFLVDSNIVGQRFIIRDDTIDINTLQVIIYADINDVEGVKFNLIDNTLQVDGTSDIYFISMNEDGLYELSFGNGTYGTALSHENVIKVDYISTSGELGNYAQSFTLDGGYTHNNIVYPITVTTDNISSDGGDPETIEDLRFNIPNHNKRQHRLVVENDYKTFLIEKYNNISSINVWGGESNIPVTYGQVFISIRPKFGDTLSNKSKSNIIKLIQSENVTIIEPVIIDPDYIHLDIKAFIKYEPLKTHLNKGELETKIEQEINKFNIDVLGKFSGFYSDNNLNTQIKDVNPSIVSSYTVVKLNKTISINLLSKQTYTFELSSEIIPTSVISYDFEFRRKKSRFIDMDGNILVEYYDDQLLKWVKYTNETFGDVDYKTGLITIHDIDISSLYNETKLTVIVSPAIPDVYALRNNILSINQYVADVSAL